MTSWSSSTAEILTKLRVPALLLPYLIANTMLSRVSVPNLANNELCF